MMKQPPLAMQKAIEVAQSRLENYKSAPVQYPKLDPQVYRDAAENFINIGRCWLDIPHGKTFCEMFIPKHLWGCVSDEEFATALLFMAHITEDENGRD